LGKIVQEGFPRGVTSETTPEFRVNAQSACDLARSKPGRKVSRLGTAG